MRGTETTSPPRGALAKRVRYVYDRHLSRDRAAHEGEVHRALADRTVRRAVWRAVRDERLRDAFDNLRAEGNIASDAVDRLVRPHRDADGRVY